MITKTETVKAILGSGTSDKGQPWIEFETDTISRQRVFGDNCAFIHVDETLDFDKEKEGKYWNIKAVRKAGTQQTEAPKSEHKNDNKFTNEISVRQTCAHAISRLYQGQGTTTKFLETIIPKMRLMERWINGELKEEVEK